MARRPNEDEWRKLSALFPGLVWDDVWITDGPTDDYNCIGYSMRKREWINPESPLATFEKQYAEHGFPVSPAESAVIDGWGEAGGTEMTHGSRRSTSKQNGLWESKLGEWFRITHGRYQLVSPGVYGKVLTHFRPGPGTGAELEGGGVEPYTEEELARIADEAARVDPGLRAAFHERMAAWRATWTRPDLVVSQNTYDRATGPEFEAVVALGDGIVPLVLEEILKPGGIFLIPLLEQYTRPVAPASPVEGEQSRGQRAVRSWLENR